MTRRLLNLANALSVALCAASAALWAQSEVWPVLWVWPWDSDRQFESAEGELRIIRRLPRPPGAFPAGVAFQWVGVAYWFPLGVGGAAAAASALAAAPARRRARRAREGRCPECGYDLRASPGRCPECGAAADAAG